MERIVFVVVWTGPSRDPAVPIRTRRLLTLLAEAVLPSYFQGRRLLWYTKQGNGIYYIIMMCHVIMYTSTYKHNSKDHRDVGP